MKKIITFVCAAIFSASMLADTAVLSWNLGENGAAATPDETTGNIVGAAGSAAEGWTIAMAGKADNKVMAAGGEITIDETTYTSIKNSNGKQFTVTLPEGLYASKVDFYAVSNPKADATETIAALQEFNGDACNDVIESNRDFANPVHIVKELEFAKNSFTFTFKVVQVCFVAVVTYSDEEPVEPVVIPTAILSYNLGENGADLGDAGKVNAITGAAGSAAEGWTIAMAENALWAGGGKLMYKGTEYKTLKNSNGKQITLTLPEGLYATQVEFYAVTNNKDDDNVGSLKEFNGESTKDTVFSLNNYDEPTHITKSLATPKNQFTFLFGGKQVCFIAVVAYTDEAPENPGEGIEEITNHKSQITNKVIENGRLVIIKNGIRYNALGAQL